MDTGKKTIDLIQKPPCPVVQGNQANIRFGGPIAVDGPSVVVMGKDPGELLRDVGSACTDTENEKKNTESESSRDLG